MSSSTPTVKESVAATLSNILSVTQLDTSYRQPFHLRKVTWRTEEERVLVLGRGRTTFMWYALGLLSEQLEPKGIRVPVSIAKDLHAVFSESEELAKLWMVIGEEDSADISKTNDTARTRITPFISNLVSHLLASDLLPPPTATTSDSESTPSISTLPPQRNRDTARTFRDIDRVVLADGADGDDGKFSRRRQLGLERRLSDELYLAFARVTYCHGVQ
ncbi:hypothetical protein R3P38DRAFT_2809124 [Favolaschia claudopus]|uniref:Uncharacterized protein n=1 Tax=Favolaschia claudopus TaxID=2862362 RepID=A0AAV9ZEG1_9AGAR